MGEGYLESYLEAQKEIASLKDQIQGQKDWNTSLHAAGKELEKNRDEWRDVAGKEQEERESLCDKLNEIKNWCAAYPIDIFPEPDFVAARAALKAHGLTIDAVSASNMRHVTEGIQKIIDRV